MLKFGREKVVDVTPFIVTKAKLLRIGSTDGIPFVAI
jgi:hypothetical protein